MSSNSGSNDLVQATKQSLNSLNAQRLSLEQEADAIASELRDGSQGEPMGIDTPLVDAEGYPRADIDVYRARTLRGRLAVIKTDHKVLMKDIERTLLQLSALQNPEEKSVEEKARLEAKPKPKYDPVSGKWVVMNWDGTIAGAPGGENRSFDNLGQSTQQAVQSLSTTTVSTETPPPSHTPTEPSTTNVPSSPFAKVNAVAPDSPAQQAGLRENDLILSFGPVNVDSFSNPMNAVAELVPRSAGEQESIVICVQRRAENDASDTVVTVQLLPKPWSGRGLIGCHILPYSD